MSSSELVFHDSEKVTPAGEGWGWGQSSFLQVVCYVHTSHVETRCTFRNARSLAVARWWWHKLCRYHNQIRDV